MGLVGLPPFPHVTENLQWGLKPHLVVLCQWALWRLWPTASGGIPQVPNKKGIWKPRPHWENAAFWSHLQITHGKTWTSARYTVTLTGRHKQKGTSVPLFPRAHVWDAISKITALLPLTSCFPSCLSRYYFRRELATSGHSSEQSSNAASWQHHNYLPDCLTIVILIKRKPEGHQNRVGG